MHVRRAWSGVTVYLINKFGSNIPNPSWDAYFFFHKMEAVAICYFEYGTVQHLDTLRMAILVCMQNFDSIS